MKLQENNGGRSNTRTQKNEGQSNLQEETNRKALTNAGRRADGKPLIGGARRRTNQGNEHEVRRANYSERQGPNYKEDDCRQKQIKRQKAMQPGPPQRARARASAFNLRRRQGQSTRKQECDCKQGQSQDAERNPRTNTREGTPSRWPYKGPQNQRGAAQTIDSKIREGKRASKVYAAHGRMQRRANVL